jgi:hypothetical protein
MFTETNTPRHVGADLTDISVQLLNVVMKIRSELHALRGISELLVAKVPEMGSEKRALRVCE